MKMVNITLCIHYDNTKTGKKNPELSQLFLPTTNWAHITSVTSDPIRASQRVVPVPTLAFTAIKFLSMAATLSFKHTNRILLFSLQWLHSHIYNETWMPPPTALPSLHHLLPHPASHVRLCPPCPPYGPTWAVRWLSWVSAALITLFLQSLAWTAWLFIYFSAQMVYPQRGFLQLPI